MERIFAGADSPCACREFEEEAIGGDGRVRRKSDSPDDANGWVGARARVERGGMRMRKEGRGQRHEERKRNVASAEVGSD